VPAAHAVRRFADRVPGAMIFLALAWAVLMVILMVREGKA
jgi:hypothetical protein